MIENYRSDMVLDVMRRCPYVVAAGMEETNLDSEGQALQGRYVNLFDADLMVLRDPVITPGSQWLLYDVNTPMPTSAWVIAASGRVEDERAESGGISFTIKSAQETTAAVSVRLPAKPSRVELQPLNRMIERWDAENRLLFLSFPAQHTGNQVTIHYDTP